MRLNVPRDRNSEFEPQLVKKGQTQFNGFDDKILSSVFGAVRAMGLNIVGEQRQIAQPTFKKIVNYSLIAPLSNE